MGTSRWLASAVPPGPLDAPAPRSLLVELLTPLRSPLVLVLLGASLVSALTGDRAGALIIGLIVLLSATLDAVQSHRAGRAAASLAARVALTATVLRDGRAVEVPVADLKPGDRVLLSAGDWVPADGRLLQTQDFFVNASSLTGEAFPVEKSASAEPDRPLDDALQAPDALYMGSSVVSGSAQLRVQRTGGDTAFGRLSRSLSVAPPPTAFDLGARRFGLLILRLTVLLVLATLLINLMLQRALLESFLFAVALAVGLTPELLPMIVSVTLARGALRLAAQQVIVKRPSAIQDLGAMDVLCTDKTGTLTQARIRLDRHGDAAGRPAPGVLELAWLNSHFESGLRSPLDDAILEQAPPPTQTWTKLDEVPFDFERRRVSVLLQRDGQRRLIVKGAPEDLLRLCDRVQDGAAEPTRALQPQDRLAIGGLLEQLADQGLRVLGIAWRESALLPSHARVSDESGLVFAGFVAFQDPPRPGAAQALQALGQRGVQVKIVTGDNERVTRHLCEQLGLPVQGVLLGSEVAALADDALQARVATVNLFCRVTPAQKTRILLALKARGRVVGYLGDGINDAPALHAADVGISFAGAVDVARQAADMVLLQQDLRVLHAGVLEGRRTFGNVMKYIMMATSSNFGNMASMALAALLLPFMPLLPLQVLLNNLLYDISEIALPLDPVDEADLATPRRWDMGFVRDFMLAIGPVSSVFDLLTFQLLLHLFGPQPELFRTGWFIESLATQVLVIFVVRTRAPPGAAGPIRRCGCRRWGCWRSP